MSEGGRCPHTFDRKTYAFFFYYVAQVTKRGKVIVLVICQFARQV